MQLESKKKQHHVAVSRRGVGAGEGGLFLSRLDQGLVGNGESRMSTVRRRHRLFHRWEDTANSQWNLQQNLQRVCSAVHIIDLVKSALSNVSACSFG